MPMIKLGVCGLCDATCAMEVELSLQGRVLAIRGDREDPFSRGHLCPKAQAHRELLYDPDRLLHPVASAPGGWRDISWEQALGQTGRQLVAIQREHGRDAVGIYLGTAVFQSLETTLHAMALAALLRSRNVYSANSVDALPRMLCSLLMYGSQAMVPVPDLDHSGQLLLVGANPVVSNGSAMTAPGMRRRLREIRQRGGRVVVLDPRRTETARLADEHHAVRPGSDALLLGAMLWTLLQEGRCRPGRLEPLLEGIDDLRAVLQPWTPERVAPVTGVPAQTIRQLARQLADAPRAVVYGRMGTCTQEFGTLCTWMLDLLNILTGNLDRRGGAMFPTPAVDLAGLAAATHQTGNFDRWRSRVGGYPEFNGELPVAALAEELETPGSGQLRALICVAGNPALSLPNSGRMVRALRGLELLLAVDPYINETSRLAHYVLPPHLGLEREHYPALPLGLAVRNVARHLPALVTAPPGTRPDWQILNGLGSALLRAGGPLARMGGTTLQRLGPLVGGVLLAGLIRFGPHGGRHGLTLTRVRQASRTLDLGPLQPRLPGLLDDRQIQLVPPRLREDLERLEQRFRRWSAQPASGPRPLCLIWRRQPRILNTWLANCPGLAGKTRCTLQVHPDDAARRGVQHGQQVLLRSRTGSVTVEAEVTDEVRPGVVCLPFGWGHDQPGARLSVASQDPGVGINELTDERLVDSLSGCSDLSVPVELITRGSATHETLDQAHVHR